ncbi:hypothetical protein Dgeo_3077 (plasmid) [Deinococcus geothermalis DSM 11300]|uniref:Uncharacterized protein n=1 Tax=Deinococcus geothermalis (strain DSM 11300 / CIP 105573 / AG-3a) TaxID=319795 RepID=A8ZRK9_DEIGD|nr:hypothetical protein [Deinococcus geothermalis]ABW35118.1 hypothetical protein Dgeo_3077 [Deinococcus geothermalis DSM 11300]
MQHTEYRGLTITDHRPTTLACPFTIRFPVLGSIGARTEEEARAKVDAFLAQQEAPLRPGEARLLAILPGGRMHTASAGRRAAERARGQKRQGGRFA